MRFFLQFQVIVGPLSRWPLPSTESRKDVVFTLLTSTEIYSKVISELAKLPHERLKAIENHIKYGSVKNLEVRLSDSSTPGLQRIERDTPDLLKSGLEIAPAFKKM
ncbi:hypothetical protein L218DRAFT_950800 [Marasmius fiardii PR-910]|nr:hypothetical protein L218DRAFT_950800 [Marasmius fiardii PR-910]